MDFHFDQCGRTLVRMVPRQKRRPTLHQQRLSFREHWREKEGSESHHEERRRGQATESSRSCTHRCRGTSSIIKDKCSCEETSERDGQALSSVPNPIDTLTSGGLASLFRINQGIIVNLVALNAANVPILKKKLYDIKNNPA